MVSQFALLQVSYLQLFMHHVSVCVPKLPYHLHINRRHWLVLLNTVPLGFVFSFLITSSTHRLNNNVDNAAPCLCLTTISKVGDIFSHIFTLLFVFSMVILTSLTMSIWFGIPDSFLISTNCLICAPSNSLPFVVPN